MGWKVEYKNFERFLNNHSEHLPLKKFKTLQRLNRLKKSKLEKGSESYEAIVLGDEEFIPMALNVSIMIHVGEVEELKKEYNRLSSHYESTNGYLPLHNHEDSFCSIPLREQNSYLDCGPTCWSFPAIPSKISHNCATSILLLYKGCHMPSRN